MWIPFRCRELCMFELHFFFFALCFSLFWFISKAFAACFVSQVCARCFTLAAFKHKLLFIFYIHTMILQNKGNEGGRKAINVCTLIARTHSLRNAGRVIFINKAFYRMRYNKFGWFVTKLISSNCICGKEWITHG